MPQPGLSLHPEFVDCRRPCKNSSGDPLTCLAARLASGHDFHGFADLTASRVCTTERDEINAQALFSSTIGAARAQVDYSRAQNAARRTATLGLLEADLSPEDARQTIKSLDGRFNAITKLSSFEKLDAYMNQHLEELINKRFGNPSATQGLCVLILVITSVFAVRVLVVALICALTLGLGCRGLLQRLIDRACPP